MYSPRSITFNSNNFFARALIWLAVGSALVLTLAHVDSIVLIMQSRWILLLLAALAALVILWKPVTGLVLYLVLYPMTPPSSEINPLKAAMLGLTVLLFLIWLAQKVSEGARPWLSREYRWMFLFFVFLCVSPALGQINGFTVLDWARDSAPFLNLLLIPVLVDYFSSGRHRWLLYLIVVPACIGFLQSAAVLLLRYHFPLTAWIGFMPFWFNSFHPSWIVGIGLSLFILKIPPRWFWLLCAGFGLAVTVLTPTRTIWISTLVTFALILFYHSRFRKQALGLIVFSLVLFIVLITVISPNTEYASVQGNRFNQFLNYQSDVSFQSRLDEMDQTEGLFLSSPLYGVGFGYQYSFWRKDIAMKGRASLDTNFTHNDFTNVAAKGGVIGLLLLVLMFRGFIRELMDRRKGAGDVYGHAWATTALIILFSAVITGLSTPILQARTAMFYLAVILALGMGFYQGDRLDSKA